MQIRKAQRKQARLRIGLSSPSGAGKSMSALKLAKGITGNWNKVGVIDTENGSADLYSHLGEYNVLPLEAPFTPERYIEAINALEDAWMEVIIIDSVTHEWDGKGGCLESNEKIAQTKFKGNTWSAWSVTTPKHQSFIEAITNSSCHIITTARSKTETVQLDGKIKKLGMKDIQREWFEYELTIAFNIDRDTHTVSTNKDRTGLFMDKDNFIITEETGKQIAEWNASWVDPEIENKKLFELVLEEIQLSITIDELKEAFEHAKSISKQIWVERFSLLSEAKEISKEKFNQPIDCINWTTSFEESVEYEKL